MPDPLPASVTGQQTPPAAAPASLTPEQIRIQQLEQQLAAANGRVAPMQQQLAASQQALAEAKRIQDQRDLEFGKRISSLEGTLQRTTSVAFDPLKALTPEEAAILDPEQQAVFAKMLASVAQAVPAVAEQQTKQMFEQFSAEYAERDRQSYLNYMLNDPTRGLSDVPTLMNDPKFNTWLNTTDEGQLAELALRNLASAPKQDMDRLAKIARRVLQPYQQTQTPPAQPGVDLQSRLASAAQRQPTEIDQTKINEMAARAEQLARSRNPADRQESARLIAEMRKFQPKR